MRQLKAADMMIPLNRYPHVPYWFTLRRAIVAMERSQIEMKDGRRSLPRTVLVFDEKYQLMGIVRRRDILRGLVPNAMQDVVENGGERDPRLTRDLYESAKSNSDPFEDIEERLERVVSEVMQPIQTCIEADTPLMEVIRFLVIHDVSLVPVIDNGKVVGVVRSIDVLQQIAEKAV